MKKNNQISTEFNIMQILGITADDLFWIRTECGVKHLHDTMGEELANTLIKSKNKEFWNWYLRIWTINDKQILKQYEAMPDQLTLEEYIKCQRYKAKRYSINRAFINLKSIIKNVSNISKGEERLKKIC